MSRKSWIWFVSEPRTSNPWLSAADLRHESQWELPEKLENQAEKKSAVLPGLTTLALGRQKVLPASCSHNSKRALGCWHVIISNDISSCLSNHLWVKQEFTQLMEQLIQPEISVAVLLKAATLFYKILSPKWTRKLAHAQLSSVSQI